MLESAACIKSIIEQTYDGAAPMYDCTGPSIFAKFGSRLVEHMPIALGSSMLDIATGKGAVLLPAARRVGPDGHVTGIDLSNAMLQEAERAARDEGIGNVRLQRMDAERLEFPDRTFDAVTCGFALFLFPDMEGALHEMYRVCKPGGHIGVALFDRTPPPMDPGWPLLYRQFMGYRVGARMPQRVAYAPHDVKALLIRSGFHSIETHSEVNEIVYADLEDWWAFQLTLGARTTLMAMNEEKRKKFKEEYLAKLRPILREDGLHISVGIVFAVAER